MKVAIVHYHLRRGGVTNVIRSAQAALRESDVEVLVISGETPPDGVEIKNLAVIPGLNYRKTAYLSVAEGLKDELKRKAKAHFGSEPDLWHFHNHSLGKNVLMPLVITGLAEENARMLLQMHDFPEDGRPKNYVAQRSFFDVEKEFARTLYPRAAHVHYATINSRDRGFLRSAGMKSERLHLIPNSVSELEVTATPSDRPFSPAKDFLLYPTRAIRRKNLGEMLLLAHAFGDEYDFATSLVPENPEWTPIHDQWKALSEEFDLPITFGIGQDGKYTFNELTGWSDAMLTTSIAEGFGLAFLEPWLTGKSVVGRNLPRITDDFKEAEISLDHLYDRINVPISWIDKFSLRQEADDILRTIYLAYDRPLPKNAIDQTFSRWIENGSIDFGMLNETYQTAILKKAISDPGALEALQLPPLVKLSDEEIRKTGDLVRKHYSLETYGEKLLTTYQKVAKSSPGKIRSYAPKKVLDQFLDPWRLNLLRT